MSISDLLLELEHDTLNGDEQARECLLSLGAVQGLRGISKRFDEIADNVVNGFAIVPQLPGEKKPAVRWKEFQTRTPHVADIYDWFRQWPDAGPAVVLGAVSGLGVIDVDGEAARKELLRRLGHEPQAPKVLSGSRKPYRYHLFFRSPAFPTKAKATPWHPQLEIRGHGGIVVLPPAIHKSGNAYRWAPGKSLNDISLPPLPGLIVTALLERKPPSLASVAIEAEKELRVRLVPGICRSTREFLSGKLGNANGWNARLFRAACDMAGNGVPLKTALPLLVAGARPWNADEEVRTVATIESAYSQPRISARSYGTISG